MTDPSIGHHVLQIAELGSGKRLWHWLASIGRRRTAQDLYFPSLSITYYRTRNGRHVVLSTRLREAKLDE